MKTGRKPKEENPYVKFTKDGFPYVDIDFLAGEILQDFKIRTIYNSRNEEVWVYDTTTGLWKPNGREIIKTECEQRLNNFAKIKPVNEVFEKIKRITSYDRTDFETTPEHLICISNGILDVKKIELLPFSSDYNFKTKLNLEFMKNATCPLFNQFVEETFYPEDIPVVQEWIGFHLYKKHFIKKATIFFGPKDTGKTVFLKILTTFVGEKNKVGLSLHRISRGDKFALGFLKDKLANIYDDLSLSDVEESGGFKIATGGGYISAEYKFGDSFEFLNHAKNTFATNKIPELKEGDADDAYYLRWLPIPCDNEIPQGEQDPFLIDKLTTKSELSGILNWALTGLSRLLKNGKFTFEKTPAEIKYIMEGNSNSVASFAQNILCKKEGSVIQKSVLHKIYCKYAIENKLKWLTQNQLSRQIPKYVPYLVEKRTEKRLWGNIAFKDDIPGYLKDELDTLLKLKGEIGGICKGIDMYFPEASKTSNEVQR